MPILSWHLMNVPQKMAAKKPPYLSWNEHIAGLSNPKKFMTEYPTSSYGDRQTLFGII
nr:hypothetical protein [Candidatus Coxiella mudrowiae]